MKLALLLAASLLSGAAIAQVPQKIVADKSQIRFVTKQMNVPVEGAFRRFEASVVFDPANPGATKAEFDVDLGSIDLGTSEGDTEAKRKAWLNVGAFPHARFVSSSVKQLAPNRFEAAGAMTIKGITLPVVAPFTLTEAGGLRTVEGQFTLRRLAFKIGEGPWADTDTVADEVLVRFRFAIPITK